MWCAIADPRYTLKCQISSRSVYSVTLCWRKIFLPFFGLRHLVLSPIGNSLTKLVHNYKPSPIQRHQNRFCTPTRLHSEIWRTISDVQKRDEQIDRQTEKQTKTQRFWPPRRRVKSEPHQSWHGDRGPRARSCIPKTFGGLTHSFAARGH